MFAVYISLSLNFPQYPKKWELISKGQTRSEVLKLNIVDPNEYIPVKLLDQQVETRSSIIYGNIHHILLVSYDDEMKVDFVQIRCETTRFCPRIRKKLLVEWTPNK